MFIVSSDLVHTFIAVIPLKREMGIEIVWSWISSHHFSKPFCNVQLEGGLKSSCKVQKYFIRREKLFSFSNSVSSLAHALFPIVLQFVDSFRFIGLIQFLEIVIHFHNYTVVCTVSFLCQLFLSYWGIISSLRMPNLERSKKLEPRQFGNHNCKGKSIKYVNDVFAIFETKSRIFMTLCNVIDGFIIDFSPNNSHLE